MMEYYSASKRNEILTRAATSVNLENIRLKKNKPGHIMYDFIYMKCAE